MRILIVEDEPKVAAALAEGLKAQHYAPTIAVTGEDGFFLVQSEQFDLVILDVVLPGRSGIEILRALRACALPTPVLILTARDAVEDRVLGLDSGADDYLVKPFAFPELLARIRALVRRGRTEQVLRLKLADLEMDLVTRRVVRAGVALDLTQREFDLLEFLLRHSGHVVTREMLARELWKETARVTPLDNVIDVQVTRLRRKLDDPFPSRLLHTVRGVGFVLRGSE